MDNPSTYPIRGRRCLVTGASGFIGQALLRRLIALGAEVHGVSRQPPARDGGVERWWTADLTDAAAVDRLVAECRPTHVGHLAGAVTGPRDLEIVPRTFAANRASAVNLMVAAARLGDCRVVLAGSLEEPPPEAPNPLPSSPYAASKWAASGYARMFHALYGLPVAIARIFMVYGPGQADTKKMVPYVSLAASRGEVPKLMSGGRPVDWIYVDDVAEGLAALMESGVEDGRAVDLGSGELVTTGEVAARICRLAGTGAEPEFGAVPDRAMEQVRKADPKASEALIGWTPSVPLDEGLRRTLAWYGRSAKRGAT